jgi:UPF0288 family protein (methanogenesis marker protein 3)
MNEGLYSLGFRGRGRRVIGLTIQIRLCGESEFGPTGKRFLKIISSKAFQ